MALTFSTVTVTTRVAIVAPHPVQATPRARPDDWGAFRLACFVFGALIAVHWRAGGEGYEHGHRTTVQITCDGLVGGCGWIKVVTGPGSGVSWGVELG